VTPLKAKPDPSKPSSRAKPDDEVQSRAFHREAGVDPNVDLDEVVRRLAQQERRDTSKKG